ncbi:archaellin/type IV pilin N-terminal domain-containing protein [Frondihabitans sp. Leaf304]|uniref:archaellin/type IV pilin N-terminal domain-containing protein n=1 Tax=Frondihabitans sp. Leaf304 TaxID=1736329 RepID=UPI0006F6A567|nr:archaellin/type IV pilin N-terminal domain-containing protein [Frondihabitans sp. Leaf304]KQQ27411.1 hypothetical protein ASF54_00955 [Frondihabitans sp. Leaf304]
MTRRVALADAVAQLGRRWILVAASALLALVAGVALVEALDGRDDRGLTPIGALVILFAFLLAGGALGLAAGIVLTRLEPRVTTADDVRRVTGLPVVAQLPRGVVDADDLAIRPTSSRMRSALREAVMNVRSLAGGELPSRLVLARADDVGEVSGVDGGYARALLESGFRPALVQADIESQLLARPSTVRDTALDAAAYPDAAGYQRVPVPDLVASARPERLLGQVESLFGSLGERYDAVVTLVASNSHPLPLRAVAPLADAVVIVVRSNRTTVEDLLAMHGELVGMGVEPLGVLMTSVAGRHRIAVRRDWAATDIREARAGRGPVLQASSANPDLDLVSAPPRSRLSIADLARLAEEREAFAAVSDPSRPVRDSLRKDRS